MAIVLVCSVLLPALRWDWLRSGAAESETESNSTTIRNIGFLIAGVLALVFAVWRGVLAQRQAETARHQSETSQQGLLNERYQKGAEMLGSDVLTVRLGGIYALQRLAEEHPEQYHVQIMELFCAFVRTPTGKLEGPLYHLEDKGPFRGLREDAQAIMSAIGNRSEAGIDIEKAIKNFELNLYEADLRGMELFEANLSGASLLHTNLSDASLEKVELLGIGLTGANLSNAFLSEVNLRGSWLIHANLYSANLSQSNLSNTFLFDADLSDADLYGSNLAGASLSGADLSGAKFVMTDVISDHVYPATGLTQAQLDEARSDPDNPPDLEGVLDAATGEQLVWQGRPLGDEGEES